MKNEKKTPKRPNERPKSRHREVGKKSVPDQKRGYRREKGFSKEEKGKNRGKGLACTKPRSLQEKKCFRRVIRLNCLSFVGCLSFSCPLACCSLTDVGSHSLGLCEYRILPLLHGRSARLRRGRPTARTWCRELSHRNSLSQTYC